MAEDVRERRQAGLGVVFFLALLLLISTDLVFDSLEGAPTLHVVVETLILAAAVVGLWLGWRRFTAAKIETRRLEHDLEQALEEARRWRGESRDLIQGLGAAIDQQFQRWELTPAESEIGMLLLKGLSHKEIAQARQTSERTVREQARSLYKKAGLSGRSELSAFFLEDLLLPHQ